jgi:hypothetical protein
VAALDMPKKRGEPLIVILDFWRPTDVGGIGIISEMIEHR